MLEIHMRKFCAICTVRMHVTKVTADMLRA